MTEADNDRLAELTDAVRKRAQVAVVAASGDLRDRSKGGIPLHDRNRAVPVDGLSERSLEGFPPAAVIPDEVRLGARYLSETGDRLVGIGRSFLVNAQVGGRVGR
jgi:hypothetical protein